MTDINLLYSIWTQLVECVRSGNTKGAAECLELMKRQIEDES